MLAQMQSKFLAFFANQYFILAAVFMLSACDSNDTDPQLTGITMGTNYSVQWKELPDSVDIVQLRESIETRLQQINDLMSTYLSHSQLSGFNRSRETGWHAVEPELAELTSLALEISRQSKGAFDVTVGPLVNLWGFGPDETEFVFPTQTEIDIAKRSVGYHYLQARLEPAALNKKIIDLYVDLSAIAKGYAVDQIAEILNRNNFQHYMIEIGGEVKGKGTAPHGEAWRIGIEAPRALKGNVEAVLSLNNVSVATSGNYRNFFEHEGVMYSHTIDPVSGYPVKHNLASVTVIHESATLADAWATAFMVMGPKLSYEIAQQNNLAVYLITQEGIQYKTTASDRMRTYIID